MQGKTICRALSDAFISIIISSYFTLVAEYEERTVFEDVILRAELEHLSIRD